MSMSVRKLDSLVSLFNKALVDLPSPSSISYFWNFGSLLGAFLFFQILSGLFLSFQFSGDVSLSFISVVRMMRDVEYGWLLRVIHANGASIFFMLMYIHIGRGLYYGSYSFYSVWLSGVTIFLLSMVTAFLGYVLPWGQMSYWAATVITNLLSAVPYLGVFLVEWVWGGFSVGNPTLTRFFAFHFVLPFIVLFLVVLHLFFLHEGGSSNPMGLGSDYDSVMFHPFFLVSDVFGMMVVLVFMLLICLVGPFVFMDVENFMFSNPMVTPVHIQPEWYFLFAYSILRSISSKIGGVVALVMSVLVFYFIPLYMNQRFRSFSFYLFLRGVFWWFLFGWIMLTWIGACEVEIPYVGLGSLYSCVYFSFFLVMYLVSDGHDKINE